LRNRPPGCFVITLIKQFKEEGLVHGLLGTTQA